jgi:hypothetical protein
VQSDGTTTLLPNAFTQLQLNKFAPGTTTNPRSGEFLCRRFPETRTNLGINNVGGVTAAVQISLVDRHGLLIAQTSTTVPPFGMRQINNIVRYLESTSTVTGREGYLILESNRHLPGPHKSTIAAQIPAWSWLAPIAPSTCFCPLSPMNSSQPD